MVGSKDQLSNDGFDTIFTTYRVFDKCKRVNRND